VFPISVLSYSADLPADANVSVARFADDTAVLAIHTDSSVTLA